MLRLPRQVVPRTLHEVLGCNVPHLPHHKAGPTPSQVINCLEDFRAKGGDAIEAVDEAVSSRLTLSIQDASGRTYASHLNMIEKVCNLLGADVVPATIKTIRRASTLCNNPQTLKGWLAAWKRLHLQRGEQWAGDGDSELSAIRLGTFKSLPLAQPKKRIQKQLLRRMLHAAIKMDEFWIGAGCCLAYVFGLRVPSELLGQGRRDQFRIEPHCVRLVDLKRKGRADLSRLVRNCTCSLDAILCPHPWLAFALQRSEEARLFDMSPSAFHEGLRSLLVVAGVSSEEAALFTSHSFRCGSAADILHAHGLQAMLGHGERASPG